MQAHGYTIRVITVGRGFMFVLDGGPRETPTQRAVATEQDAIDAALQYIGRDLC